MNVFETEPSAPASVPSIQLTSFAVARVFG